MSQNDTKEQPRKDLHGQQYFQSFADRKIRDTLSRLGFKNGNTILVIGDGSNIEIARPPAELLPKIVEAIQWVEMTQGNVTFQRGPEGGGQ